MPTITISSSNKDTQVYSDEPNKNYGNLSTMWVGRYIGGKIYKSLIQFDLSAIPNGINITKAILKIYVNSYYNYNIIDVVTPYRIIDKWDEYKVTWATLPRIDYNDFGESCNIFGFNYYNMNITNLVKSWYSGQYENNGLILSSLQTRNYEAKSIATSKYPDVNKRPSLTILYEVTNFVTISGRKTDNFIENVTATYKPQYSNNWNTSVLSTYSVFIKNNGNCTAYAKIEISPDGTNWTEDGNEIYIEPGKLKYMIPYIYSGFIRIMYKSINDHETNLTLWFKGQV